MTPPKYGILIDGSLLFAPKKIKNGDSTTYNPPGEMLEAFSYKPIRFTDPPETEPGYYAVSEWAEEDGEIVQKWHIEKAEPTDEEILSILLGGEK